MNEPMPAIPPINIAARAAYKDRSAGLVVFGVLTLLLGCLAGLLSLLMFVSLKVHPAGAKPVNPSAIIPAISVYGGLAVALIWLGIGSIMARRWARALLLIFSWSWLVLGVVVTGITPFLMARVFATLPPNVRTGQPAMSPPAISGVVVGMVVFFGVIFVLLPAIWVFFYGSRHVKATCEARDPVERWTDACPLPVLGACLWLFFNVPMLLFMIVKGQAVMPFFGIFLTGLPGLLYYLLMAVLWTYAAWLLYQLDVRGWWLILIIMLASLVSALLTFAHHDITELFQKMAYPQAQIESMRRLGLLTGNHMVWIIALCSLPYLGYLLFIKRYLPGKKP